MSWPERIVIDPEILAGKPVVRGTRLAVEFILELLAAGQSEADIFASVACALPVVCSTMRSEREARGLLL